MIKSLLTRWPFLVKEQQNYNDAFQLWRRRLVSYLKGQRFRSKLDIPEILEKKCVYGKRKGEETPGPDRKKINQAWGIPNFNPPMPEGEDDKTMGKHSETLKAQSALSKERQNKEMVKMLMEKTFPDRRNMLINQFKHIREILEKYPLLCNTDQVNVCNLTKKIYICYFFCFIIHTF